jgi:uncharacterized RDD family membrane protein YckC
MASTDAYDEFHTAFALLEEPTAFVLAQADRSTRFCAVVVDLLLLAAAFAQLVVGTLPALAAWDTLGPQATIASAVLGGALVGWNLWWLHRRGQTVGKWLFRIRIVRSNGDPVGLGRVLGLRLAPVLFASFNTFAGVIVQFADPLMIFGGARRCLHDQLADTIVVKA